MNKKTLCAALVALLAVICPTVAPAQTTIHAEDYWHGHLLSDPDIITDEPEGKDRFFLYNVGTGLMLYMGGNWGTQATCSSQGKPLTFTLQEGTTDKYGITASFRPKPNPQGDTGYNLAFIGDTPYWDRRLGNSGEKGYWKFVLVDEKKKRYALMATSQKNSDDAPSYLYAESNTQNTYGHIMTKGGSDCPSATDELGLWKIVTRDDLIKDFENTYSRPDNPSDATFLVRAENFNNQNANVETFWHKMGNLTDTVSYRMGGLNGKDVTLDKHFGRYYNLGITKAGAGSYYYQKTVIPQAGWFRLDCQGLYYLDAGKGSAKAPLLFAIVVGEDGTYTSSKLCTSRALRYADEPASPLPRVDQMPNSDVTNALKGLGFTDGNFNTSTIGRSQLLSGIAFYPNTSNGHKGCYPNELAFFVPEGGREVTFGVYFPDTLQGTDNLFVDDFKMKYLGKDFVITEDALPENHNNYSNRMLVLGDSYNPGESMHKRQKRSTLILKRHFDQGVWNSIVLPVSLTRQQVINAFGAGTRLAKLDQLTNNGFCIHFDNVKMDQTVKDSAVVLEAGKIYLIRPTSVPQKGKFTASDENNTELLDDDEYYVIDRMSMGYAQDGTELEALPEPEVYESVENEYGKMQFTATYNKIGVYGGSYVFSKGNLYHLQDGAKMLMKGLRGYINVMPNPGVTQAPQLSFIVDGIDETTGVSGVTIEGAGSTGSEEVYYRLDGTRAGRLGQLPRGIYVAKGRKILVK